MNRQQRNKLKAGLASKGKVQSSGPNPLEEIMRPTCQQLDAAGDVCGENCASGESVCGIHLAQRVRAATAPSPVVVKPEPRPTFSRSGPPLFRCARCGCPKVSHGEHPEGPQACHDCECTQYEEDTLHPKPTPIDSAKVVKAPAPKHSPAARDERMRRKGRFPDGTKIVYAEFSDHPATMGPMWSVSMIVPVGSVLSKEALMNFNSTGPGIHGCIESLWDQYLAWKATLPLPSSEESSKSEST